MNENMVQEIRLSDIGLDPRPERQIRPLNQAWVESLMTTDPSNWDPIHVRAWPTSDPYPAGQEGRRWQVISGYHRVTAAEAMRLPTIRGIIEQADTDEKFLLIAVTGNVRHGLQMSREQLAEVFRRLYNDGNGLSYAAIGKQVGMPAGTVANYVTSRDTNKSRHPDPDQQPEPHPLRNATDELANWGHVTPTAHASDEGEEELARLDEKLAWLDKKLSHYKQAAAYKARRDATKERRRGKAMEPTFKHAPEQECLAGVMRAYQEEGRVGQTLRHYFYKLRVAGLIVLRPDIKDRSNSNPYKYTSKLLT